MDTQHIALFHMNDTNNLWKELNTTYLRADNNYYYYRAVTSSFSYFYIGEKNATVSQTGSFVKNAGSNFVNLILGFANYIYIIIGIVILLIVTLLILRARERKKVETETKY